MGKITISKSIVDGRRSLIGFVLKGREKDLGGFSDAIVERATPMGEIINKGFSNNQMSVVKGKLMEINKFHINELPMCVYTGNSENPYIDVDNTVNLIQRFVQNNENIGFRLKFSDGSEENLRYENVLSLCKWFKPGNFCIRTSSSGKSYISGKGGMGLDTIPEVVLGKKPEVKPKRMRSAAKEKKQEISGNLEMGFDVLDVYDFVKKCGGSIINLPTEKYEAATEDGSIQVEGFKSLGIGEVAPPDPKFNATKLNVNASFKKVGIVPVKVNGAMTNLTSYVFRTKSIFLNGENYIKKFGIAVAKEREDELVASLGKSLSLAKITDKTITQPLSQVIDADSLAFYSVDTSKIDLISEKKREASVMSAEQLTNLMKQQYSLQLLSKALGIRGGILKDLKDVLGPEGVASATERKKFGLYAMMNDEALKAITDAGIDIYTGAFIKEGTPAPRKPGGASAAETVEIVYTLKGYDASKVTGKQIISWAQDKDTTQLPEEVIKYLSGVFDITDFKERYRVALKMNGQVDAKLNEINKKLWMHNASMYLIGGRTHIHTHDKDKWIVDTTSKVKTAQVYACTVPEAAGLIVKFKGVNI